MTNVPSKGPKGAPAEHPAGDPAADPAAVAGYVAAIAGELSRLARASGLGTLAYILEMAQLEAKGFIEEGQLQSGGEHVPGRGETDG